MASSSFSERALAVGHESSSPVCYQQESGVDWGRVALYGTGAAALIGVTAWIGYSFGEDAGYEKGKKSGFKDGETAGYLSGIKDGIDEGIKQHKEMLQKMAHDRVTALGVNG